MADNWVANESSLSTLVGLARADSDFDLMYRRFVAADRLSRLTVEQFNAFPSQPWYREYWRLVGECRRETKYADAEKNLRDQTLEMLRRENDQSKRQLFAAILLLFGDIERALPIIDRQLWASKFREDFATFMKLERTRQVKEFLRTRYASLIERFSKTDWDSMKFEKVAPKDYKIFYCWLQGREEMPPLVRCCFNSVRMNAGNREICFIDEKNYSAYVDLPSRVIDKYRSGKISRTHFSDILRGNLLEHYGGLWLDATMLVTEPLDRHQDFWTRTYFTQKYCHEKNTDNPYVKAFQCYASYARWGSFLQGSCIKHHPLFVFLSEFCREYWRDFDEIIDYVLIDFIIDLAYENIPFVHRELDSVPINNLDINTLVFHLNEPYVKYPFDKIINDTFFHKLSWKTPLDLQSDGTVFREIVRRYG